LCVPSMREIWRETLGYRDRAGYPSFHQVLTSSAISVAESGVRREAWHSCASQMLIPSLTNWSIVLAEWLLPAKMILTGSSLAPADHTGPEQTSMTFPCVAFLTSFFYIPEPWSQTLEGEPFHLCTNVSSVGSQFWLKFYFCHLFSYKRDKVSLSL
jgi:hypothetical protein